MSGLTRRGFLRLAGAGAALAGAAGCGAFGIDLLPGQTGELLTSELPLPAPFQLALRVPPVKRPSGSVDGADLFEITQRVAQVELLPGVRTPILGYDGIFPGPTLETRSGRPVVVRHRNELPVPTVVHLHGGHTPADQDGWPLDLLLPANGEGRATTAHRHLGALAVGQRDYRYPMSQPAATLWYHDHRMDFTGPAVYRGLAGFHLVRDEVEDRLALPHGERDLPLMICDRSFAADGSLRYPSLDRSLRQVPGVEAEWSEGVLGDVILVNGTPWPVHEVDATRYRLRLLNGSNARRYRLALQVDGRPGPALVQIGSDAGLLDAPISHQEIDITPGERFDVVVDFAGVPIGSAVTLVNLLGTGGDTGLVIRFVVARPGRDDSTIPAKLAEISPLTVGPSTRRRDFRFVRGAYADGGPGHATWTINGQRFDPDTSLADVALGETEIWRFGTDLHHPVHLHLDPFQVLARGSFPERARSTPAGRTPSTCGPPRTSRSRCGSPSTPDGSCCTATTSNTRTWR